MHGTEQMWKRALRHVRFGLTGSVFLLAAGCRQTSDGARQTSLADATMDRDTVRVVTRTEGVWGPAFDAVEILRVPSDRNETTFGLVREVAPLPNGGVLVFDAQGIEGRVLRAFDANGQFTHTIGRAGNGPGEYAAEAVRITVQPDGTMLLHQPMRLISRYGADGRFRNSFPVTHGNGLVELFRGADGSFFTPFSVRPAAGTLKRSSWPMLTGDARVRSTSNSRTMFRYDTTGTALDSVSFVGRWLHSNQTHSFVTPSESWFPLPDGRLVVLRTDVLGFLLVDPTGRANPLIAQVPTESIEYNDDERKEWELTLDRRVRGTANEEADRLPLYKKPAGSGTVDPEGRIWVQKQVRSEKVTPYCTNVHEGKCISRNSYAGRPCTSRSS
ncbi:6-bladed beta-propeller [Gemmatimonas sp.]|uniref:6-bladed beta-propeller n=1 Tax=Gemmatimonas sp. TaxID=1962908 RepID=UPI00398377FC